jgi:outer membrane lipoprotein SlyB
MKRILAAVILAGAALAAGAAPYAPQEFDFSDLDLSDGTAYGAIESIQPVQQEAPVHGDVFEHALQPDVSSRLLIRLDDGAGIALLHYGPEQFQPGQRVQVVRGPGGLRAEPAGVQP